MFYAHSYFLLGVNKGEVMEQNQKKNFSVMCDTAFAGLCYLKCSSCQKVMILGNNLSEGNCNNQHDLFEGCSLNLGYAGIQIMKEWKNSYGASTPCVRFFNLSYQEIEPKNPIIFQGEFSRNYLIPEQQSSQVISEV